MTAKLLVFPHQFSRHSIMSCTEVRGIVVKFPGHCRAHCPPDCDGCFYCEGGLFACTTCGGAESSLTTHCSGERVPGPLRDLVSSARLDYVRGRGWLYRYSEDGEWIHIAEGLPGGR
jgi:hypothetical protein